MLRYQGYQLQGESEGNDITIALFISRVTQFVN